MTGYALEDSRYEVHPFTAYTRVGAGFITTCTEAERRAWGTWVLEGAIRDNGELSVAGVVPKIDYFPQRVGPGGSYVDCTEAHAEVYLVRLRAIALMRMGREEPIRA